MIIGKYLMCACDGRCLRFMIIVLANWIKMIVLSNERLVGQRMTCEQKLKLIMYVCKCNCVFVYVV